MEIPPYPTTAKPPQPKPDDIQKKLGEAIKNLRLAKNWRQEDLAQEIGVSVKTIKSLEAGKNVTLSSFASALCYLANPQRMLEALQKPSFNHVDEEYEYYVRKNKPKRYSPTRLTQKKTKQ